MKNTSSRNIMARAFRRLLTTQIISSLTTFIGPLVDGVITSNFYGSAGIASFGIANPVVIVLSAIAAVFMAGSQGLSGRCLGRGDTDRLNRIMTGVTVCAALTGAVLTAALLFGAGPLAGLLGASEETLSGSSAYIRAMCIGVIPILLTPTFIGYLQIDGCRRLVMIATGVMTVTDIVLDLLNVLVFRGGMFGMGLATAISYYASAGLMFVHFARGRKLVRFTRSGSLTKDLGAVLTKGLPSASFLACNTVRVLVLNRILAGLGGTTALALFSTQNTLRPLTVGFTLGTGVTTLLVTSVIIGEGNRDSLRQEFGYILKLAVKLALVVTAAVIVFAKYPLAKIFFAQSDELASQAAVTIRLYALSIPFCMVNSVFLYYCQSMGKLVQANVFCILDNTVFTIGSALLLGRALGTTGVWLSYLAAEVLTLLLILLYTALVSRHFPRTLPEFMLLPKDFGVPDGDCLNITVSSKEEAVGISEEITEFCKRHGADRRTTLAAGLCIEELAVIAMDNADGRAKPCADIYLTFADGGFRLRMRDNSRPFDVSLLAGNPVPGDPAANVGIRLVKGMAKDIRYNVALGLNVFSLKL